VVRVEHARDAVEPETVELVLLEVEAQVRQEEPQDLVVAVVEQAPARRMPSQSALGSTATANGDERKSEAERA